MPGKKTQCALLLPNPEPCSIITTAAWTATHCKTDATVKMLIWEIQLKQSHFHRPLHHVVAFCDHSFMDCYESIEAVFFSLGECLDIVITITASCSRCFDDGIVFFFFTWICLWHLGSGRMLLWILYIYNHNTGTCAACQLPNYVLPIKQYNRVCIIPNIAHICIIINHTGIMWSTNSTWMQANIDEITLCDGTL